MNMFFNVGNAVGMLTGGVLGDLFAKRFPRYARPFVNQLSMIIIAPLFFILYKGLPGMPSSSITIGAGSVSAAVALQSIARFHVEQAAQI